MASPKKNLKQISEIVDITISEIYFKIKNIKNKYYINKIISEICAKHNINEKHIRLIGDFFNDNNKKLSKKITQLKPEADT